MIGRILVGEGVELSMDEFFCNQEVIKCFECVFGKENCYKFDGLILSLAFGLVSKVPWARLALDLGKK